MHIDVLDFVPARQGLFTRIRQDIARKAAARREYRRVYDELLKLDDREMDELGIGRGDFDAIARGTFRR